MLCFDQNAGGWSSAFCLLRKSSAQRRAGLQLWPLWGNMDHGQRLARRWESHSHTALVLKSQAVHWYWCTSGDAFGVSSYDQTCQEMGRLRHPSSMDRGDEVKSQGPGSSAGPYTFDAQSFCKCHLGFSSGWLTWLEMPKEVVPNQLEGQLPAGEYRWERTNEGCQLQLYGAPRCSDFFRLLWGVLNQKLLEGRFMLCCKHRLLPGFDAAAELDISAEQLRVSPSAAASERGVNVESLRFCLTVFVCYSQL